MSLVASEKDWIRLGYGEAELPPPASAFKTFVFVVSMFWDGKRYLLTRRNILRNVWNLTPDSEKITLVQNLEKLNWIEIDTKKWKTNNT